MARGAGAEPWLGAERGERLARAFERVAEVPSTQLAGAERFYATLARPEGLPGRPWYRNTLWAPGLETGYAAETLPTLRLAARVGDAELDAELDALIRRIDGLLSGVESPR